MIWTTELRIFKTNESSQFQEPCALATNIFLFKNTVSYVHRYNNASVVAVNETVNVLDSGLLICRR
jgi:hypothetical protein